MVRQGLQDYGAECSRSCCTYSFRSVAKGLSVLGIAIRNRTGVWDKVSIICGLAWLLLYLLCSTSRIQPCGMMVVIALASFLVRSETLVYTPTHVSLHLHGKHSTRGLGKSQDPSSQGREPYYDNDHLSCEHGGINLLLFLVLTNVDQSF